MPLKLGYDRWSEEKDRVVSSTLATAPLFLVQGPPGTGKSTYVIGLMRHILSSVEDPNARILVVSHMHSAIDDLHARVEREFAGAFRGSSWDRPLLLRLRTPRNEDDEERTDREMAQMARQLFQECLDVLEQRGDEGTRLALRGLRQELEAPRPSPELQARMIEAASIIFTTCTDKHLDAVSRTDFDWVIVEEAGRLVGCDLIIPMRLGHRWVLIGDPNQMGPYRQEDFREVIRRVLDEAERDNELQPGDRLCLEADGLSLLGPFDTLYGTLDASQREMLTQQHRMHPHIRQVVSNAFYGGKLCDDPDTAGKMPFLYAERTPILGGKAVLWLDVPHQLAEPPFNGGPAGEGRILLVQPGGGAGDSLPATASGRPSPLLAGGCRAGGARRHHAVQTPAPAHHTSLARVAKPRLGQARGGGRSLHGDGLPGARGRCRHAEHGA